VPAANFCASSPFFSPSIRYAHFTTPQKQLDTAIVIAEFVSIGAVAYMYMHPVIAAYDV
jgi:hypothetical protein